MKNNTAREKLNDIIDQNSFKELWSCIHTYNFLNFTGYDEKLKVSIKKSNEKEAVITGVGSISGVKCMFIVFEPLFMMGSMGLVVGEKILRAFHFATKKRLPVISITASSGARMQEGVISLIQMVKTSAEVYKHNKKKLLFISVISDPTYGGVTASFASLADVIIGEKGARFGFAGKRIIEETTHEKLSKDFQTVEYSKVHGMVDMVVNSNELQNILRRLLRLHMKGGRLL